MLMQLGRLGAFALLVGLVVIADSRSSSQEPQPAPMNPGAVPGVPQGVEVLARGPIHEAFATPSSEAKPTQAVPKRPPAPLEELPPEEKPEGEVVWVGGYWGWDDDRQDFLWVSGCWRIKPQEKEWVAGYWRQTGHEWQWVPGFWNSTPRDNRPPDVTYYPEPPAPPAVAPGVAPGPDMFYVPGYWMWNGDRYAWRAGYWNRARAGYVYVPSHYRWSPSGYVFIAGYWDLAVSRRGVLYAPVYIDAVVVGPRFAYTPYYAVTDTVMLDAMFIRPASCHYYFGDYYSPRYTSLGYESCAIYSRRHYEPIIVYQAWEYRDRPRWFELQIGLTVDRYHGRAPVPPRTLVQQNTVINNVTVNNVTNINNVTVNNVKSNVVTNNIQQTPALAPAKNVLAARGEKTVALDAASRTQVRASTQATQQAVAQQRVQSEQPLQGAVNPGRPRVASLNVPPTPPVGKAPSTAAGNPSGVGGLTKPGTPPMTGGLTKSPTTPTNPSIAGGLPKSPTTNPPMTGGLTKSPTTPTNPPMTGGLPKSPTNPPMTGGLPKSPTNPPMTGGLPKSPNAPAGTGFTKVPPTTNPGTGTGAPSIGQPGSPMNPPIGGPPISGQPTLQPPRTGTQPPPRPGPPRKDEKKKSN
jgi:hypothetical protein